MERIDIVNESVQVTNAKSGFVDNRRRKNDDVGVSDEHGLDVTNTLLHYLHFLLKLNSFSLLF